NCIEYRYGDALHFDSPTIGVENPMGTAGESGNEGTAGPGDCLLICPTGNPCPPPPDCNDNGIIDTDETAPEYDPLAAEASDSSVGADFICTDIFYNGDTWSAGNDALIQCGLAFGGLYDVFYCYRPSHDGLAVAKVCDFEFYANDELMEHVAVSIHTAAPASAENQIECNFASSVLQNCGAIWWAQAGQTYYIRIAGEGASRGVFSLEVKGPRCLLNPDDVNRNGVPDECECFPDVNGDGVVDDADGDLVADALGSACEGCPEDVNHDGVVDETDLQIVYASMGPCPFDGTVQTADPLSPLPESESEIKMRR
ncbi:MAG: hypothetical protein ACYTGC_18715, partial [Planctomycetota bacterium]